MSSFVHAGIGRTLAPVLCLPDCVNVSRLVAPVRQWYEELGGEVVLLGKPAAVLYEEALRLLTCASRRWWPSATRCSTTLLVRARRSCLDRPAAGATQEGELGCAAWMQCLVPGGPFAKLRASAADC